jgi:hypothetical protein
VREEKCGVRICESFSLAYQSKKVIARIYRVFVYDEQVKGTNDEEAEAFLYPSSSESSHGSVNATSPTQEPATTLQLLTPETPFNIILPLKHSLHIPSQFVPSATRRTYLARYLRANISSLALQNRTFFIHPSTLSPPIPSPLESALTISALSTLSSPSTFTILDSHLETLITTSPQTFYSPLSILHSVQALIIYQLIRLFSSNTDPEQIYHAEAHFPLLNRWTITLQTAYFDLPSTTTSFKEWIIKESIRRTILTSVMLRSFYCSERDGYTALVPLLASLPVSSNGSIWEMEVEECDENVTVGEEVVTYFEFIMGRCKNGMIGGVEGKGNRSERLLLCLEEDGGVGEAALELLDHVRTIEPRRGQDL